MNTKTLEEAFNAVFHDEESFFDFCNVDQDQEIEELNFKARKVFRTSNKLKKYLRFVDRVVLRHLEKSTDVVHSYVRGRSVLTAVKAHCESKYFFTTDIQNFFSNITEDDVRFILDRDRKRIPISDLDKYFDLIVGSVVRAGVIPVGFPTSPQISNAYLLGFDNELHGYCVENKLTYTRYSDDLIISANEKERLFGLQDLVQKFLSNTSEALKLNVEKTRITHLGNKVKILGLVVTPGGKVTIDSKYKNTLESLLHFYINDKAKFSSLLEKTLNGNEHSLFGLLHYARSVDPEYVEKLQRKYGAFALSTLMEDKSDG